MKMTDGPHVGLARDPDATRSRCMKIVIGDDAAGAGPA